MAHTSNVTQRFKDMVTEDGPYDVVLAVDEADAENDWVGLVLTPPTAENPNPLEGRVPVFGSRQSIGRVTAEDRDPLAHLVWQQTSFAEGALKGRASEHPRGYAKGNMDAVAGPMGPGFGKNIGGSRGNTRAPIGWMISNPHFESDADDGWTDESSSNGTVDMQSVTDARSVLFGSQSCEIVWTGTTADVNIINQSLANFAVWAGEDITVSLYFKKTAGSGGIQIEIDDGVATTRGTGVTTAADYVRVTVTHTVNGSPTELTITVETENTSTFTGYIDDVTVYSGASTNLEPVGIVEHKDGIYMAAGRIVGKLDTSTVDQFKFDAVYVHGSAVATDIITYWNPSGTSDQNVFVAFGDDENYIYGDDTTWTVSGLTGTLAHAKRFAVSRNQLWKSYATNLVASAIDPLNTSGDWDITPTATNGYTVGSDDHPVTELYGVSDTILVGKEDGLWSYLRTFPGTSAAHDGFINNTRQLAIMPDINHFRRGIEFFDGLTYMPLGDHGLVRTDGKQFLQDITSLITNSDLGVTGKIYAMAAGPGQIFAFTDDTLLSLLYDENSERLLVHTRADPPSLSAADPVSQEITTTTTAYTSPSANANFDDGGDEEWNFTGSVLSSNDEWAVVGNAIAGESMRLDVTDFGFAIPSGAEVVGIEVRIERNGDALAKDVAIRLLKAGAPIGDNKADTSTAWPLFSVAGDVNADYGSASDSWGAELTANDVNDADFGVSIKVTSHVASEGAVDHVQIKVTYRESTSQDRTITPKAAGVVPWAVSGTNKLHLLACYGGQDTTDDEPYMVTDCWALPDRARSHITSSDDDPGAPPTQFFYTTRWDKDAPTEVAVASHLEVRLDNPSADEPWNVYMGTDGADGKTDLIGTLDGSEAVQTIRIGDITGQRTKTPFRDVQLYFEKSKNGTTNKSRVKAFELHAYLLAEVQRTWQLQVHAGGHVLRNDTQADLIQSREALHDAICDFESSDNLPASFFLIHDFDRDGHVESASVVMRPGTRTRLSSDNPTERFALQETLNKS